MKKAQLIGLAVALVAAGGAVLMTRNLMKPAAAPVVVQQEKMDVVPVLVARTEIALGQVANEASFRWQEWPREAVGSFITKTSKPNAQREFSGAIARSPILPGEPITPLKLIKAGSGGVLAAILPPGMRAVAIRIEEKTAVGRLILPNDHVDVLLTTRVRGRNGGAEDVSAEVLFRNIRVLSIGQQIEVKETKKSAEGNIATLELSPAQAEMITQASSRGEISLVLRSIADIGSADNASAEDRTKDRGNSIRVLRYGTRSKAYGVN